MSTTFRPPQKKKKMFLRSFILLGLRFTDNIYLKCVCKYYTCTSQKDSITLSQIDSITLSVYRALNQDHSQGQYVI